ncbi:immunoglobulin domain-containing protein [Opitutus sp. ER46]|uniref:immunoglobulin domain-containing protein n=1 Tax=Opitutus sp. ER46 TaxID=2161864 RepID=UPI000D2FB20C|nr:immunoglobulin domain-containing protein [Opitutus sp. ER46]PTX91565.1 hypothetical protein DB354_16960 [Opitutus sp. ER46]
MHLRRFVVVFVLFWSALSALGLDSSGASTGPLARPSLDPSVQPPILVSIAGGGTVETGERVTMTVTYWGSQEGVTYQWQKDGALIAGATNAFLIIGAATAADAGTYEATVTNAGGSNPASTTLVVKPLAPPAFTAQPESRTVHVNQTAVFTFSASGSYPRTFQWLRNGAPISSATDASLTIEAATLADAAGYSVVVTNSQGAATSGVATLTVNAAVVPVCTSTEPSDVTVTAGGEATFRLGLTAGTPPYTYQWLKNGAAIAGATRDELRFASVTLGDAGKYSIQVVNIAGTATSREAVLTVNPATPVTFQMQPVGATVVEGQSFELVVGAIGSPPITYQWEKDGVPIPDANKRTYRVLTATPAHAGVYRVAVTNPAGTVYSKTATVVVDPAVPPTITTPPASVSIGYFGDIFLTVAVAGTGPFTYQWSKDGVALAEGSSSNYQRTHAQPSDTGSYTVTVANKAGSVTSSPAVVTVAAPRAPTIALQPVSARVPLGQGVSFRATYVEDGTGPLTAQWRKNGSPLPGATTDTYSIQAVKGADAGRYSLQVTGLGGTVTSDDAILTVVVPQPPALLAWSTGIAVTLGKPFEIDTGFMSGTGPFDYQWYLNGTAIVGATGSSYSVSAAKAADLGSYTVRIIGPGGVTFSSEAVTRLEASNTAPWVSTVQLGDIVYFLATQPGRIERYDMATEKWLPTVLLSATQVPTAFLPMTEGVYVAYGRALVRRSPSLAEETAVLNATAQITELCAYDAWLYYFCQDAPNAPRSLNKVRRSDFAAPATVTPYTQITFSAGSRRGYGILDVRSMPTPFTIDANGAFTPVATPDYPYAFPRGSRSYLLAGEAEVATTGGAVFRTSDMSYVASLGQPFLDLVSRSDGATVVFRNNAAHLLRAGDYVETARATVPFVPMRAFGRGTDVFAFGAGAGSTPIAVAKLAPTAFVTPALNPVTTGQGERMSFDGVFFANGIVHLVSRSKQAVVRWSTLTRSYLTAVPLRGTPRRAAHTPGSGRALLYYGDGVITSLPLTVSAPAESTVAVVGNRVGALTDMDGLLLIDALASDIDRYLRVVVGADGQLIYVGHWHNLGTALAWNSSRRRLYAADGASGVAYETVPTTGVFGGMLERRAVGVPPLRLNADGSLIAMADGRVTDAGLDRVGTLANSVLDAAWLSNRLYTLRADDEGEAEVQRWLERTYLQDGSVAVPGLPVAMFAISDKQLVVVTSAQGYLVFTVLNADLTVSTTGGGMEAFAGVYLAKLGTDGAGGDLALLVRANGSAVLVGNVLGTNGGGLLCENVTLGRDGTFVANALDPRTNAARTVSGVINGDGTLSGSVYPLELTFTGSRATGSGGLAGYYVVPPLNGALGGSYGIVAPDGRAVFFAYSGNTSAGGLGTFANGQMTLTPASGAQLTVTIDGGGSVRVIADKTGFAGQKFGGLRDGVRQAMRLFNISSRGRTGDGLNTLVAGFVISGSANRNVLIRAVGPTLSKLSVKEPIADPKLSLYQGSTLLKEVDNWSSEANAADIAAAAKRTQAFELPNPSKDAALYVNLPPAIYTVMVTPAAGSHGVALVEVYDGDDLTGTDQPHLANISTRGWVGTGEDVLVAGVVVSGNTPKRVLIRGIGPRLTDLGVSQGALADPILTLRDSEKVIATNDNWGTQTSGLSADEIIVRSAPTGAFGLLPGSKDAVLLLTLEPGLYTAILSGKGDTTGTGMIEVYEVN